ncbi:MAG: hypothetical protein ACLFUI_08710, partial [Halanaerobiales bacterium]
MSKTFKYSIVFLMVISLFLLAACGGSGGDSSVPASTAPVFNQIADEYLINPDVDLFRIDITAVVPGEPDAEVEITASGDLS